LSVLNKELLTGTYVLKLEILVKNISHHQHKIVNSAMPTAEVTVSSEISQHSTDSPQDSYGRKYTTVTVNVKNIESRDTVMGLR